MKLYALLYLLGFVVTGIIAIKKKKRGRDRFEAAIFWPYYLFWLWYGTPYGSIDWWDKE